MVVPVIIKTQHQPDTKKARAKITWKLIITLKLVLVIVPVLLTAASGLLEKQSIDYSIAMVLGCGLACFSLLFFVIQYALAGLLRTKIARLW
jgi:hypothetical protein